MYKLFCFDKFIGEFHTLEEVEKKKHAYAREIEDSFREDIRLLDEMVKELKNVFPKPESYSRQQYKDFVKATYPKFFALLDEFTKRRTDVEVLDFFFSEPNGEYVGLKIKKENSARGYALMNLNTYYLHFYRKVPCAESFKVVEE